MKTQLIIEEGGGIHEFLVSVPEYIEVVVRKSKEVGFASLG